MKYLRWLPLVALLACNGSTTDSQVNLPKNLVVYHSSEGAPATQEAVTPEAIPTINAAQFKERLAKSPQVLMEFYAPWCQACKDMVPELIELHRLHPELPIYKINVDDEVGLANDNNVAFVPTLILFRHGHRAASLSGYNSEAVLERFLQSDYL
jgi:thioredoxin reductase (NADPH)